MSHWHEKVNSGEMPSLISVEGQLGTSTFSTIPGTCPASRHNRFQMDYSAC